MNDIARRVVFVDGVPVQEAGHTSAIDGVANLVRTVYCSEYRVATGSKSYGDDRLPQWDGGDDAYGRHHRCVWPRLAQFFIEQHISPMPYIRLQFGYRRGQSPPTPTMLMSAKSLEQYRAFEQSEVTRQREDWSRWCQLFVTATMITKLSYPNETNESLASLTLLGSQFRSASPLFKYCLAARANLSQVASTYYADALLEYVFQRHQLNQAIGADIPDQLRIGADALYARLCRQEVQ